MRKIIDEENSKLVECLVFAYGDSTFVFNVKENVHCNLHGTTILCNWKQSSCFRLQFNKVKAQDMPSTTVS